ncbi:hypothetical protein BX661DRAFT_174417 [Kickxella alabastrina]|uniref:uncharacterized protein n=1 Tax=Kickxella alabastrina TaxID=61397 RepID=UPI00221FB0F4|nr:uncharacterized protein BX661DRAFT_174417 [Kickxella alabastrina]KAI7818614.1 hypothetical protein BX661DRAFT_174417 [Kickxella alabastrina]
MSLCRTPVSFAWARHRVSCLTKPGTSSLLIVSLDFQILAIGWPQYSMSTNSSRYPLRCDEQALEKISEYLDWSLVEDGVCGTLGQTIDWGPGKLQHSIMLPIEFPPNKWTWRQSCMNNALLSP